jgi:hypothetical protein
LRKKIAVSALAATAIVGFAAPAAVAATGPFDFTPIAGSAYGQASIDWTEPYVLPEGFSQSLVSDETVLDVYPGIDDLHDMNTQNETGPQAGRYLYNTYEVGSNGAVGVTDLKTGKSRVIAQREEIAFDPREPRLQRQQQHLRVGIGTARHPTALLTGVHEHRHVRDLGQWRPLDVRDDDHR